MRFACPQGQVILFSITREEQIVVLLARPTANGRDSINHHTVVRVAQNIVLETVGWSVQSHTTKVTTWDARLGILKEICLELPCGVRIQEVDEGKTRNKHNARKLQERKQNMVNNKEEDEGKTVTRTMEEICGHVNKDEVTANTWIARRHEPGVKNQDPGGSTQAEHSGCATQYPGGERKNIAQAVVSVPRTRTPTHRRQGRPPTIA